MKVLGVETSCDETAASVVQDGHTLLSNTVASSVDLHKVYGGVVPEIAARSHLELILPVIDQALESAKTGWTEVDAIAVTVGPGLGGSLLVGALTARTLAITKNIPLFPVNHVEAHVYGAFLTATKLKGYQLPVQQPEFPALALIVSGGHTQLVLFKSHSDYEVLEHTLDDAVGEAFDKVAKILGLPYPGGPSISAWAEKGNPKSINLPTAWLKDGRGFSYSGLKTATLRATQSLAGQDFTFPSTDLPSLLSDQDKANIASSFQATAVGSLVEALADAATRVKPKSVIIAGGVAANTHLRELANEKVSPTPIYPDIKLCTDNGGMIAAAGCYQLINKSKPADPYTLEINPSLSMLDSR